MLRCTSASSWGPSNEFHSFQYKAFLQLILSDALPGWLPFLYVMKLESPFHEVICNITGCFSPTPIFVLLSEVLSSFRVTNTPFRSVLPQASSSSTTSVLFKRKKVRICENMSGGFAVKIQQCIKKSPADFGYFFQFVKTFAILPAKSPAICSLRGRQ